jgi:hypothetical protein
MSIAVLPEKLMFKITLYLDESDVKELVFLNKPVFRKMAGNLLIKNRILAFELRYAQAILKVISPEHSPKCTETSASNS